ncbi:hypothetical protein D3C84_899460 [compost metagenome]
MDRHPHRPQADTARPSSEQRVGAGIKVFRVFVDSGEGARQCCDTLFCQLRDKGVRVFGIQSLHRVSNSIEPACNGDFWRKSNCQINVIKNNLRQHFQRALCGLQAILCLANNRCSFGAGIGRRNDDLR